MQLLSACTLVTRRIDFSSGRVNGVYHACEGFIKNYCRKDVFYATIYRRRRGEKKKEKRKGKEKKIATKESSKGAFDRGIGNFRRVDRPGWPIDRLAI